MEISFFYLSPLLGLIANFPPTLSLSLSLFLAITTEPNSKLYKHRMDQQRIVREFKEGETESSKCFIRGAWVA